MTASPTAGAEVILTAQDGHSLAAYRADPTHAPVGSPLGGPVGRPMGGIVVVQEIFGVNRHIRDVVDRFAERGFTAIAPALFDRVERGVELDYTGDNMQRGRDLRQQIPWDHMIADIDAAVADLSSVGKVAVVGYCLGGSLAWLAASRCAIAAAVGYYGPHIHEFVDTRPACPVLLHFGAEDHAIPLEHVELIRRHHPDLPVHVYDGAGHGFNCDRRPAYHEQAASQALARTLDFLTEAGVS